jgi:hypothetical protein
MNASEALSYVRCLPPLAQRSTSDVAAAALADELQRERSRREELEREVRRLRSIVGNENP